MAALEKIRKRAVILTIVIGAGLLAFILEEAVRASSSFFNDTTAAKVGDEKIEVQEFQNRLTELNQENQNNKQDPAIQQQQVLQQMIFEKILNKEYEKAGISVSNEEMARLLDANPDAQQITQQVAQQLQGRQNIQSPSQLDKLIQSQPDFYVQILRPWNNLKKQIYDNRCAQKLAFLMQNSIQPNDIDRLAMQEESKDVLTVEYAKKEISTLDDAKFKPTEAEIKAVYDQFKDKFWKLDNEMRIVNYIAVNLDPSNADLKKGKAVVQRAYALLQGAKGLDSLRTVSEFGNVQTAMVPVSQAKTMGQQSNDSTLAAYITNGAVGSTHMTVVDNNYTLFKIKDRQVLTDSVVYMAVAVEGNKQLQDSVLAMLNAGKDVSKVKGVQVAPEAQTIQLQNAGLPDSIKNKFTANAGNGYFKFNGDAKQALLVNITKTTSQTFTTMGTSSYEIMASKATRDGALDKLQAFLNKNKTTAEFKKNALKAGYQVRDARIDASTPQLQDPMTGRGIENSRKAIKWALTDKEAKVGAVSPIFRENNDVLLAVAIDKVYDGKYVPMTEQSIKEFCTTRAMAAKKATALEKQYKGKAKDVAGYAKAMGTTVETAEVTFGNDQMGTVMTSQMMPNGMEGDGGLIGRVAGSKVGSVNFWKGNNGVYAFRVLKSTPSNITMKPEELNSRFMMQYGIYDQQYGASRLSQAIMGSVKVVNNTAKFY